VAGTPDIVHGKTQAVPVIFGVTGKEPGGRAAQLRHPFDINDQTHPKRAGPVQDCRLRTQIVQRSKSGVFNGSFNDSMSPAALASHMACARSASRCAVYQRIVVENNAHLLQSDHQQDVALIVQVSDATRCGIRHKVIRT